MMLATTKAIPRPQPTETGPMVSVIDDDAGVRRSVVSLLGSIGLESQAFASARDMLDEIKADRPGCLIVDMRLPDQDGLDLLQKLRDLGLQTPAIIVTAYADVPSAVRAMKLDVIEFFEKPFHDQSFLATVQKAIELDSRRFEERTKRRNLNDMIEQLSPRERDVLQGIIEGKSSKIIAVDLQISPKTVENHRSKLMEKLDANNVAHLVMIVHDYFAKD